MIVSPHFVALWVIRVVRFAMQVCSYSIGDPAAVKRSPSPLEAPGLSLFASEPPHSLATLTSRDRRHAVPSRPANDLGNMRELGVRSLAVTCELCHHEAVLSAERWGDGALVRAFRPRMVCTQWESSGRTPGQTGGKCARKGVGKKRGPTRGPLSLTNIH